MIPTSPFSQYCNEAAEENEAIIRKYFCEDFNCLTGIIDLQNDICQQYAWVLEPGGLIKTKPETTLLFTAFFKNLISINSSVSLLSSGFYGSSRIILRNIYEFLLISKYVGISNDSTIYNLWAKGQNISVRRAVLKKIDLKDKNVLGDFWGDLCKYTHSMIYSQQIEVKLSKSNFDQIKLTIVFIKILVECNYHLLSKYTITPSMKYYASTYGNLSGVYELKNQMRKLLTVNKKNLDKYPKEIIKIYKSEWKTI